MWPDSLHRIHWHCEHNIALSITLMNLLQSTSLKSNLWQLVMPEQMAKLNHRYGLTDHSEEILYYSMHLQLVGCGKEKWWKVFERVLYNIAICIEAKDLKQCQAEQVNPKQFHKLLALFSKTLAYWMPPHQPGIDYLVGQSGGETPVCKPLYSMITKEQEVVKDWLQKHRLIEWITQSSSPLTATVWCPNIIHVG